MDDSDHIGFNGILHMIKAGNAHDSGQIGNHRIGAEFVGQRFLNRDEWTDASAQEGPINVIAVFGFDDHSFLDVVPMLPEEFLLQLCYARLGSLRFQDIITLFATRNVDGGQFLGRIGFQPLDRVPEQFSSRKLAGYFVQIHIDELGPDSCDVPVVSSAVDFHENSVALGIVTKQVDRFILFGDQPDLRYLLLEQEKRFVQRDRLLAAGRIQGVERMG